MLTLPPSYTCLRDVRHMHTPAYLLNTNVTFAGAQFAFSIYDFEGKEEVDAYYLGDVLRALNLNPTLEMIEKLGGQKIKKQKKLKLDEFLPIFSQVKKDKDQGGFEDFMECLKLYDKAENGTMMAAELSHVLLSLGERLSDKEVTQIMAECCDEEDEDGFIPYEPFLKKICTMLQ
ncbi:myosin light chain 1-like isoform X4 [Pollicipes pollicipes]|uniref:myosin light chain 1-like isoform X4 n=1 Tax=Pollicipes pollicipes TaxID=41117 RepID=UPI0018854020|nr:myosin light chain 1-like isoform X4 [Pollicipes pollicipes]XP_037092038.1 myosin light chain 1-like isoform X4 [Pollicipes pollicipes]